MQDITRIEVSPAPLDFHTQGDFDLVYRLLRDDPRYKIPEHLRDNMITCINNVIQDSDANHNTKLAAIRVAAMLDKINVDIIKAVLPKKIQKVDPKEYTDEQLKMAVEEVLRLQQQKKPVLS